MARTDPKPLIVEFEIDSNGNPVYRPAVLRAKVGDRIEWRFKAGAFAVLFRHTPFDRLEFGSDNPGGRVRGPSGVYSYSVALVSLVEVDGRTEIGRFLLDAGCPEIIIQK